MKILLISDTHGELEATRLAIKAHPDVDLQIALGDIGFSLKELSSFVIVKGNHDHGTKLPPERIIEVQGHRIWCVHGDMFEAETVEEVMEMKHDPDRNIMELCMETLYKTIVKHAKRKGCDVVFFGHTHIRIWETREGITIVNPGSLLFGMDGNDKSYAIVDVQQDFIHVEFYDLKGKV